MPAAAAMPIGLHDSPARTPAADATSRTPMSRYWAHGMSKWLADAAQHLSDGRDDAGDCEEQREGGEHDPAPFGGGLGRPLTDRVTDIIITLVMSHQVCKS
jgi:hypothetical protein